jgi:hypothetical protein
MRLVEGTIFEALMCDSIESFLKQCFKGNGSFGVLVLRVEPAAADNLGVCSAAASKMDSNL